MTDWLTDWLPDWVTVSDCFIWFYKRPTEEEAMKGEWMWWMKRKAKGKWFLTHYLVDIFIIIHCSLTTIRQPVRLLYFPLTLRIDWLTHTSLEDKLLLLPQIRIPLPWCCSLEKVFLVLLLLLLLLFVKLFFIAPSSLAEPAPNNFYKRSLIFSVFPGWLAMLANAFKHLMRFRFPSHPPISLSLISPERNLRQ